MNEDRQVRLLELLERITDKLDDIAERLDDLIDMVPSRDDPAEGEDA